MKFFFHTQRSRTNGFLLFVSCVIFFPSIVSCDDQTAPNAEELVSEAQEEMASTNDEVVALTEEPMNTATEVVVETADSLSSPEQTQTEQLVAEADTAVSEDSSASDAAAVSGADKPYTVSADGKVDWYTFNGFRRYHSECHVCHGPAGMGSSFAPNLTESVTRLGYEGFLETVVNGRLTVSNVENKNMPSFATNMNVMCYIDDIYAYLVARADGIVGTERPDKEAKPEAAKERDNSCSAG